MKHEVRGSNSGFIRNGEVITTDASGCLRTILVRDLKLPEETPNRSFANIIVIGALNELRFAQDNPELWREEELTEPVTEFVTFSGHADFVGEDRVYETKSISSKKVYKQIIEKGVFKPSNLAQLVRYMLVAEKTVGELVYTSYVDVLEYQELSFLTEDQVFERLALSKAETRKFLVEFAQDGAILVDKKLTGFSVQDSWEHLHQAAEYLEANDALPPRPVVTAAANPCFFCPLRAVCDSAPESKEEFLKLATTALTKEFTT